MATSYYNLPTINGSDTIDGVNAINGLANATDTALHNVAIGIPDTSTIEANLSALTASVTTAQSTATTAQTVAQTANTTANRVADLWASAPIDILISRVSPYATSADDLTAYSWGNVVVVKFVVKEIPVGQTVTVGTLNSEYAPTSDITVAGVEVSTNTPAYIGVRGTTGAIVAHSGGTGEAHDISGIITYLANVQSE